MGWAIVRQLRTVRHIWGSNRIGGKGGIEGLVTFAFTKL
jgi:hypothetical protein